MARRIAVLNAGSSSIKFAVFAEDAAQSLMFAGQVEGIGVAPKMSVKDAAGQSLAEHRWDAKEIDHRAATRVIFELSTSLQGGQSVEAVGHRVVHGGTEFAAPVRVTREVVDSLRSLCPLAPLHQPHNLAPIEAILAEAPQLPQVACFDTAFHRSQPPLAQMFALPRELTESGVRRYGFHGLSYEFVIGKLAEVAPQLAQGRVIVAHLGNGASLCATDGGRS